MTRLHEPHQVHIEVDGHLAASAELSSTDDLNVVRCAMHVESGHQPPGTQGRLVDAVIDDPAMSGASHLSASMPTGDTDLIDRIRERTDSVEIRAAGATKLVEADLRRLPS